MAFQYLPGHVLYEGGSPGGQGGEVTAPPARFGTGAEPPMEIPGLYSTLPEPGPDPGVGLGAGVGVTIGGGETPPEGSAEWWEWIITGLGVAGMVIPEPITTIVGAGLAGAGVVGLLTGGGEGAGEGVSALPVPIGGPGLAEPGKPHLIKEWHISYPKGRAQYYLVQRFSPGGRRSRYIMMYKTWDKTWTWWPMPRPTLAVIGKNMPSHKMLTRLKRNLARHGADARTILKIVSPATFARQGPFKRRQAYVRRRH